MKLSLICLLSLLTTMSFAKSYILVGSAGFKTYRPDGVGITELSYHDDTEVSAAWEWLPRHQAIEEVFYLAHVDGKKERKQVLNSFLEEGEAGCREDLGLLIVGNSWGSKNTGRLAKEYYKLCKRKPDFVVLVDGIVKPLNIAYRKKLIANYCVNFYQRKDSLVRGNKIKGCYNVELYKNSTRKAKVGQIHVEAEWKGVELGSQMLRAYLNGRLNLSIFK